MNIISSCLLSLWITWIELDYPYSSPPPTATISQLQVTTIIKITSLQQSLSMCLGGGQLVVIISSSRSRLTYCSWKTIEWSRWGRCWTPNRVPSRFELSWQSRKKLILWKVENNKLTEWAFAAAEWLLLSWVSCWFCFVAVHLIFVRFASTATRGGETADPTTKQATSQPDSNSTWAQLIYARRLLAVLLWPVLASYIK